MFSGSLGLILFILLFVAILVLEFCLQIASMDNEETVTKSTNSTTYMEINYHNMCIGVDCTAVKILRQSFQ